MALWVDQTAVASGLNGLVQGRFVGVTAAVAPTSGAFAVGDFVVTQNGNTWICVTAGSPGTWTTPGNLRNVLDVGEETVDRSLVTSAALVTTTQTLRLAFFTARKTETSTQVRIVTGTTAAAATPTVCRLGLYTIASDGAGTLVASTANDTTLFAAASTSYTRSWSSSYAKVAGQRYAMGALVVTTVAAPTLAGTGLTGGFLAEAGMAPRVTGAVSAQTDLPSSFTGASVGTGSGIYYMAILP